MYISSRSGAGVSLLSCQRKTSCQAHHPPSPAHAHARSRFCAHLHVCGCRHARAYSSAAEEAVASTAYAINLVHYMERNANEPSATFGPDLFSDVSMAEFLAARAGYTEHRTEQHSEHRFPVAARGGAAGRSVPAKDISVDWRDPAKNPMKVVAVTAVKNQGAFGTCWSFGASGCLEGMMVIQQGEPLVSLSEQEFIDCCVPCQGSGPQTTWDYLINNTKGTDSTEASCVITSFHLPC